LIREAVEAFKNPKNAKFELSSAITSNVNQFRPKVVQVVELDKKIPNNENVLLYDHFETN
jgi:hypothetical protein